MKKINFQDLPSTDTPIKASTLNTMQSNIEESCVAVSPTQPTTGEKVWIQKTDTYKKIHTKNENGQYEEFADLGSRYKILWNNTSPSSNFDANTNIEFSSADYDLLLWLYKRDKDSNFVASNIIPKGYDGYMGYVSTYGGQNSAYREVFRNSDTSYRISGAFKGSTTAITSDIIPITVIGISFN